MQTSTRRVIQAIITASLVLVAAGLAFNSRFYTEAIVDAFFSLALASVVILHLRIQAKWPDVVSILIGTGIFAVIDFQGLHYAPKFMAWFSFLGMSSFLVMGVRAVWATKEHRRILLYASVPAALFVVSEYFASTMLDWTAAAHPKTLDLYLLSFDGSLRFQFAFAAGRAYALYPWLHTISLIAYVGLAIPITLVYAGRLLRFKENSFQAMLAFLITGPLGIIFYNLFPASGPHNVFLQSFPFHPLPIADLPRVLLEPIAITGPRNAMPSLHLAWTLLAWWYSRGLSWAERLIVFAFLALTAFATLGTGEHWVADLIVAFPFALMIQAICAFSISWRDARRLAPFLAGLIATLSWLALLRYGAKFFWTSPVVPWTLSAATIMLVCISQLKLDRVVGSSVYLVHDDVVKEDLPTRGVLGTAG